MNKFEKTVAFAIILCTLLSSLAGCKDNKSNAPSDTSTKQETTIALETNINLNEDTAIETGIEAESKDSVTVEESVDTDKENSTSLETNEGSSENEEETSLSPQEIEYKKFQDSVDSNVYDKWLNEKLDEGVDSPKNIYATYLALWKNELTYTVGYGKSLFEDSAKYEAWKKNLEEWLEYTSGTLTLEMNQLFGSMTQLEIIIPHCTLVRQKVIDTKYFLYKLEIQNTTSENTGVSFPEVSIKWRLNNVSDIDNQGTIAPPENTEEETTSISKEQLAEEIENIAKSCPTLDEFKAAYPDCRTVSESPDGTYDYVSVTSKSFPNATFMFERHFGENGYSKITLSSISAHASLLLPEYLNLKFTDIAELESELAKIEEYDEGYSDLYIYREDFYYYISGCVHTSTLGADGIQIKMYNDKFLSPIKEEQSINKNLETTELLKFLAKERCTYEEFQKAFTNLTVISEDESYITVCDNSLPNIEFNFCILKDSGDKTQTVLNYICTTAEVILPDFVEMEAFDLRKMGMEIANSSKYNYRTLFYYENDCSFALKLESDMLEGDTTVYVIPYTDFWVRPW